VCSAERGGPSTSCQTQRRSLGSASTADMLEHVQDNPLGNKPSGGKTSLAGVQDKIVLARTEGGWNRVIDGWPSPTSSSRNRGTTPPRSTTRSMEHGSPEPSDSPLLLLGSRSSRASRPSSSSATTAPRMPPRDASTRRTSTRFSAPRAIRSTRSTAAGSVSPASPRSSHGFYRVRLRWSESFFVVRDRIELSTFRFSGGRSYRLSYLTSAMKHEA
jgi:hypothetical protein